VGSFTPGKGKEWVKGMRERTQKHPGVRKALGPVDDEDDFTPMAGDAAAEKVPLLGGDKPVRPRGGILTVGLGDHAVAAREARQSKSSATASKGTLTGISVVGLGDKAIDRAANAQKKSTLTGLAAIGRRDK
jgi:hypothetical protein